MKTRLLLVFGGQSSEHEVSLVSARNVYDALDKEKYDVALCYISRDGKQWLHTKAFGDREGVEMFPMLGQKTFWTETGEIAIDVIFPVLHGVHGEDGDIQGLARLMHIPYVGPSLIGAAVTMDKDVTKRLLRDEGIPVVEWLVWHTSDSRPRYDEVSKTLGDVVFVKPANAGSSVGVSKVRDADRFEAALELASEHDTLVIIERAIKGREIEVAVLGNESPQVSSPGEIIPGEEFYSYDDKYSEASTSRSQIPAELKPELVAAIQKYARDGYLATRGQGMARIDFFVDEKENIYLNEINSIPGFTNISMYPKMMQHDGLSYSQLVDRLISLALEI